MHGLFPQDIYNMEMWEFLAFIRGRTELEYQEQKRALIWSHRLAIWSRSMDTKPPKPVKKYIRDLDVAYGKIIVSTEPVDVDKSNDILKNIERLKRKESEVDGVE